MGEAGPEREQQEYGLSPEHCVALPCRVETFTSENNELWKKVETLENANR